MKSVTIQPVAGSSWKVIPVLKRKKKEKKKNEKTWDGELIPLNPCKEKHNF
jgi:hypothetical protein